MLRMLLRFWPVLLPLFLYHFWQWQRRRAARAAGHAVPTLRDGPFGWMLVLTFLLLLGCFLWTGLTATPLAGDYQPPHMENGRIAPARVVP